jgi:very-short-patch-repair endonuclease
MTVTAPRFHCAVTTAGRKFSHNESVHELIAGQFGLITARQAARWGISASAITRRVASGEWARVLRGVYRLSAAEVTLRQWALAPVLWAGEGALVSHGAAAALHGFDLRAPRMPEIWVPGSRALRTGHVSVHRGTRLDRADRTAVDGIPVTTAVRTLIDLSARLEDDKLLALTEDLLHRQLVREDRLRARLDALRTSGRSGAGRLEALLDERGDRRPLESALEALVWQIILSTGVRLPERQYWVTSARERYRLDFAWPDLKLGLECEGLAYHAGRWRRDRARDGEIANLGWRIPPVTWHGATRERDRVVRWITNSVPRAA